MLISIQGRKDCDFSKEGPTQCASGGCNGGLECDANTGTGVPPVTLAEFTLANSEGNVDKLDNYDVSLVDGYNMPMAITNNQNCPVAGCFVDLGPNCALAPHLKFVSAKKLR